MMWGARRFLMNKKYIVRLMDPERDELAAVIKKLRGTSQKVRRAQILFKADADGPNWTDHRIAEAFGCRTKTVENLRQRLVERGFRETLDGGKRETPPVEKLLSGEPEARIIATRLGSPPPGYANWTLRLLARKVVELGIVESVSYETVRRTLKKTRAAKPS
jgi:Homeodomain-like domain